MARSVILGVVAGGCVGLASATVLVGLGPAGGPEGWAHGPLTFMFPREAVFDLLVEPVARRTVWAIRDK